MRRQSSFIYLFSFYNKNHDWVIIGFVRKESCLILMKRTSYIIPRLSWKINNSANWVIFKILFPFTSWLCKLFLTIVLKMPVWMRIIGVFFMPPRYRVWCRLAHVCFIFLIKDFVNLNIILILLCNSFQIVIHQHFNKETLTVWN